MPEASSWGAGILTTMPSGCRRRFATVALVALCVPLLAAPQARSDPSIERELAGAQGAARIPLLVDLATRRRDEPASALTLTSEAITLLQRHPSRPLEVRARIEQSWAQQVQGIYPAALANAERAHELAIAEGDERLLGEALFQLGTVEWRMARYPAALAHAEEARGRLTPLGNTATLVRTHSLIGAIHYQQSRLDQALVGYLAALAMAEAMGDEVATARIHNNIGLVYWDQRKLDDAMAALRRALAIHERLGPQENLVNTINNVGLVLVDQDKAREALPYLRRALAIDRARANAFGEAKAYSGIAWAMEQLGQPREALPVHRQALEIRERIGDKDGIVRTHGALGEVHMRLGDIAAATSHFERAVALAAEIGSQRAEADRLEWLSRAQAAGGDTAAAYRSYRRFHELQATLTDSASRALVAELEARYESREREREVEALTALAESRRTKLTALIVGSTLLGASLVLLVALLVTRGRSQRALAESETRYRGLFHGAGAPVFLVDASLRRVIDLNDPARALCGPTPAETVGALEPPWARRIIERVLDASAGPVPADDHTIGPDGQPRWTEVRTSDVQLNGRSCRLITLRDATERHRLEEARQREDRLEALGLLAGGIAHDFNNALTAVAGHVSLARTGEPASRDHMLALAERAALEARRLSGQLLTFARGGAPQRRASDMARLLRDALAIAGAGARGRIEVTIPQDLRPAAVDRGQFAQVITNLVINARQAVGESGLIRVSACNFTGDVTTGTPSGSTPGIRIDVADEGGGIPAEIRHRIFDPYFTTKAAGNGLGLATAFTICRNHGGALTFESREGVGTTFSAFFPAASEPVEADERPAEVAPHGHGDILVLEDEPLVRDVLVRMLSHWGYAVTAVADGREAVARYVERLASGKPFDLLLMDLTVPGGVGGREAMAAILAHHPDARGIVVSGYSDDPIMANYRAAGFVAALEKPFDREQLSRLVASVLRSVTTAASAPQR